MAMAANVGLCLVALTALVVTAAGTGPDDGYFIKAAAKSVPRIGRRGDFYIKAASKSVPRMGKKSEESVLDNTAAISSSETPKPVYLVRYARRGPLSEQSLETAGAAGGSLTDKRDNRLHEDISWKDIDRIMEERPELWWHLLEGAASPSSSDVDTDTLWRRHFEE